MDIRNILVNIDIDAISPPLINAAVDLAAQFGAELIGFAGAQPSLGLVAVEGAVVTEQFYLEEREQIEQKIHAAEETFQALIPAGIKHRWQGYLDSPTRGIIEMGRRVDLIMLGSRIGARQDFKRRADVGDIVLAAGRPVLLTGDGVSAVRSKKVLVAWKDTREARRAVADALPFLKQADEVLAMTVEEGDFGAAQTSLSDVTAWLASHGVKVRSDMVALTDAPARAIERAATGMGADLIVSGAYGHHRFREWLFGGVTQDILAGVTLNRLISN